MEAETVVPVDKYDMFTDTQQVNGPEDMCPSDWLHCVKVERTCFLRGETGRTGRQTEELWRRRTVASCIPATEQRDSGGVWQVLGRRLLQASRPDGKLEGQRFWTRNSCSTMSRDKSKWKWVGRSREDPKLAPREQGGPLRGGASPPAPIHQI